MTVASGPADREWLGASLAASAGQAVDLSERAPDRGSLLGRPRRPREAVRAELAAVRRPLDRELLVDAVWRATWPHDRLVFGSSRLVRVADSVLGGKKVPVHANRGLAGIDGTIATATGIALASQAAAPRASPACCSATSPSCTMSVRCCFRRTKTNPDCR